MKYSPLYVHHTLWYQLLLLATSIFESQELWPSGWSENSRSMISITCSGCMANHNRAKIALFCSACLPEVLARRFRYIAYTTLLSFWDNYFRTAIILLVMKLFAFQMFPFLAKTQDTSTMYTEKIINHSKLYLEKLKLELFSPGAKSNSLNASIKPH